MQPTPVILIFDVGKTNKKIVLFNKQYQVVHEESIQLEETTDEDGFPCEDIQTLTEWIQTSFKRIQANPQFEIHAINFSAYGASFVYLDHKLTPFLPLYNYLKPFPENLLEQFYDTYGGKKEFALRTASPVLGSLNSGMQLYRIKYERLDLFRKIKYALHLPQYLSFILTNEIYSDITSIGSHTNLWDFSRDAYHDWITKEVIEKKLAPLHAGDKPVLAYQAAIPCGIGLHDSSAALIPYLASFNEPFVLLSSGTWSISLNPFNQSALTNEELCLDCLCYLSFQGNAVKASRLFSGHEHEQQTKRLGEHFHVSPNHYTTLSYSPALIEKLSGSIQKKISKPVAISAFSKLSPNEFKTYDEAYHQLMVNLVARQHVSTNLVLTETTKQIFVDGGFSKNDLFMNLLAVAFPNQKVLSASVPHASALGAALIIHKHWNEKEIPANLVELVRRN